MPNPIPLPDPPCGATLPDDGDCPGETAAIITAEHPTTGYATLIWRCRDHIGAAVDTLVSTCPDTIITATPLALAKPPPQPEPEPDPPASQPKPQLHLVTG
jgi:hypothetical protein